MKKLLLLLMIIPMIGFSQQRVSIEHLTDSSGQMYGTPSIKGVRYLGDLFTGIAYVEIDDNKLIAEYNYKTGDLHDYKVWYESGKLKHQGNCIDENVNEWTLKSWYKNGNLHRKGNMSNVGQGFMEKGSGTAWHENGKLKEEVIFENGVVIKIACWDLNGDSIDCSQEEDEDMVDEAESADDYIEDEAADKALEFEGHYKTEKLSNLLFFIILLSLY